ncbi:MAG: hypothetical protein WCG27_11020 [Pseudomonadota bacterium]
MIISPGVRANCGGILGGLELVDFFREQFNKRPSDLFNELFFQLKSNKTGDFLKNDATAIFLGVDKNVIVQV